MSEHVETNFYDRLKDRADFSVLIAWIGAEDKPFYRALLVSESRVSLIENRPFWGYAAISADEFNKLLAALESNQRTLLPGPRVGEGSEYYVEIQTSEEVCHCSIGFDRDTIGILNQMANALETTNRKPILDIVSRIGSNF